MTIPSKALGLAMAAAGIAKLVEIPAYEELVEDLDWTVEERRTIGVGELIGGVLLLLAPTRKLGAGIALGAGGMALSTELRAKDNTLAGARAALMVAALLVAAAPQRD